MAAGGWDPTRVFVPAFDRGDIEMERAAALAYAGTLPYVDHPERPEVRGFFTDHADRTLFVNGILVPSIAHDSCTRLILTGDTDSTRPDWPALLAHSANHLSLPGVVVAGPSYAGPYGEGITRVGSPQLTGLLSGALIEESDLPTGRPDASVEALLDARVREAAAAAAARAGGERALALRGSYVTGLERAAVLKGLLGEVDFSAAETIEEQAALAIELFSRGISRVAMLDPDIFWDSHGENEGVQHGAFEEIFFSLRGIMDQLHAAPGERGGSMADETALVVISEMGRTPVVNNTQGKDHWPYTSAMIVGPGVRGGEVVGDVDEDYYGERVDPTTGAVDPHGVDLSAEVFGATLLALGGIDVEAALPGATPITGALLG